MNQILSINEATERTCQLLHQKPNRIEEWNKGRYRLLYFDNELILLKLTMDHFGTFSEHSVGESVNREHIDKAIEMKVKRVIVVYGKEGRIYTISPLTIKAQGNIRTTEAEGVETYSFDIKLLKALSDFKEVMV